MLFDFYSNCVLIHLTIINTVKKKKINQIVTNDIIMFKTTKII